jgi:hypothetical protein
MLVLGDLIYFTREETVTDSLNLIAAQAQASIAGDLVTASSMADLLQSLAAEQIPGNALGVPKPLADRNVSIGRTCKPHYSFS